MMNLNQLRSSTRSRKTSETDIRLRLDLDTSSRATIQSGNGFLDHMLDLFQVHGGFTLELTCKGDTHIDMHHSSEDIAIALGEAILEAIGDKKGIERYGFYFVTMDEALARVCLDLSGRVGFRWNVPLNQSSIGNMDTDLFEHFFRSVAENGRMNLHVDLLAGGNTHHCLEAIFKAFARSLAMAVGPSRRVQGIPSSKGVL